MRWVSGAAAVAVGVAAVFGVLAARRTPPEEHAEQRAPEPRERPGPEVAAIDTEALLREAGVVLVVEHVETDRKHFSGMAGPTFWLRIVDAPRFDRPAQPDAQQRHAELVARDPRGRLLEWDILHAADDRAEAAAAARLEAQLAGRGPLVLAARSAGAFSATGVVREGKWAALVDAPLLLAPATPELLSAVGDPARRPSFGAGAFSPIDPTTFPADWPR